MSRIFEDLEHERTGELPPPRSFSTSRRASKQSQVEIAESQRKRDRTKKCGEGVEGWEAERWKIPGVQPCDIGYIDISSDNLVYLVGLCDTLTRFWYVNTPCVSSVFFFLGPVFQTYIYHVSFPA
jgi:hypothetical protein